LSRKKVSTNGNAMINTLDINELNRYDITAVTPDNTPDDNADKLLSNPIQIRDNV
jgi:hypothetical protein